MIICIAEDRPDASTGVKLLLLALARHCADLRVVVNFPPSGDAFARWVEQHTKAELRRGVIPGAHGWNVKPQALLALMDEGETDLVWIDTDIILARDFRPLLAEVDPDAIVLTEETCWGQHQGGDHRARSWGLLPVRSLAVTANTGFIRVTSAHRELLEHWRRLLESPDYRAAQSRPWFERPAHMLSDQDVLTGLLSSEIHGDVPIHFLRRGRDIAQCFGPAGFTIKERIEASIAGLPTLVHAMGPKPWLHSKTPRFRDGLRDWYDGLAAELSPYAAIARNHRISLDEDTSWLDRSSRIGWALRHLTHGHAALQGLPLAAVDATARWFKSKMGVDRVPLEL